MVQITFAMGLGRSWTPTLRELLFPAALIPEDQERTTVKRFDNVDEA